MAKRFDYRTKDEFCRDIKLGTMVEVWAVGKWLDHADNPETNLEVHSIDDNGVDNSGEFVSVGSTVGADYRVTFTYNGVLKRNKPVEVKFASSAGKLTFKTADLLAYADEGADILVVYTVGEEKLKRPEDRCVETYLAKLDAAIGDLRWGLIESKRIRDLLGLIKFYPRYMGFKESVRIESEEFPTYFTEERFYV